MDESRLYVFVNLAREWVPAGLLVCYLENNKVWQSRFRYGKKYLQRKNAIPLDLASLPLTDEEYVTEPPIELFLGIKDSSPDSWGRAVMETRADRVMREDEFLLASSDYRVGALAFSRSVEGPKREMPWAPEDEDESVIVLEDVLEAYLSYSGADKKQMETAMRRYILPGSPMGGARPKAVVQFQDHLWLAKFQKENDPFDFIRGEHACMQLASQCGLDVPEVRIEAVSGRSVFLIRRFDRHAGQRLHLNSMFSILRETELSFMHSSYMDIVEALKKYSHNLENDIDELFKRMVFNGLCRNTDDHLRNHAMMTHPVRRGFRLSPLYDVVPDLSANPDFRLAIGCGLDKQGRVTRVFGKEQVLRAAELFDMEFSRAETLYCDLETQVQNKWRKTFLRSGFSIEELKAYEHIFTRET